MSSSQTFWTFFWGYANFLRIFTPVDHFASSNVAFASMKPKISSGILLLRPRQLFHSRRKADTAERSILKFGTLIHNHLRDDELINAGVLWTEVACLLQIELLVALIRCRVVLAISFGEYPNTSPIPAPKPCAARNLNNHHHFHCLERFQISKTVHPNTNLQFLGFLNQFPLLPAVKPGFMTPLAKVIWTCAYENSGFLAFRLRWKYFPSGAVLLRCS